jgi:hypothetical protein
VNVNAFKCPFFENQNEWFLTTERALALTPEDGESAGEIVRFVVDSIVRWFQENPLRIGCDEIDYQSEWQTLLDSIRPFHQDLKKIRLDLVDDERLVESAEGLELDMWASSCGVLPEILAKVQRKIRTGYFDESA